MNRVCRAAAGVVLVAVVPGFAQPPAPDPANLRGESAQTRKRLSEAEQKLDAGETAQAIEALQRILDEAGDDLVTLDGKHYLPASRFAHQLLARLPDAALRLYQDRIDDAARKLLEAAKRTRSPAPLRQLLDRYFVARPAEEALLLLGDLLFEAGEYRAAEQVWRRLSGDGADIAYPGKRSDPAAVEARLVLAAIFQGERQRAEVALAAFRARYPDAHGRFAGRDGPLAATLQALLQTPSRPAPARNPGTDWPTFGGGPDRAARVGVRLPSHWTGRPWVAALPQALRHPQAPESAPARPPFGHPVIVNGQVFVTDGNRLFGFDLVTGEPTASFTAARSAAIAEKAPADPCPSLTASGNRLYLRVGPPLIRPPDPTTDKAGATAIVCLLQADDRSLKELWRVAPPGAGQAAVVWEGAPLVAGRRMWAAYARFEGGRLVHGIACFDPSDATTTPEQPAWAVDVCDSPLPAGGTGRARHELLTLAGRHVVLCSNAGAVAAVDAATGQRSWGFRYPRSRKADISSVDPSPAVVAGGRLFVAPTDADRVYALDPETGQLLWESGPTEGAQVVGVAGGKLVVAVAGRVRGIRGLDVASGSQREPEGWVQHDGGGLLGYGRGLVSDDVILWPTRSGLFFLNPRDGFPIPTLISLPNPAVGKAANLYGNLAYADGVLVVVTPTQVWGYVSERKRFGPAAERSDPPDPVRERFERQAATAEEALAAGDAATARAALLAVARGEFPNPLRAWAVARLLALAPPADTRVKLPADAKGALPAELRDVLVSAPELRDEWLLPGDGIPVTLATLLDRYLGRQPPPKFFPTSPALDADRKDEDVPQLGADSRITRTLRLPPGSAPLRWLAGMATPPRRLFVASPDGLLAVSLRQDRPVQRYAVVAGYTHAAELAEGFVVAGPSAVAVYAADREPVWVFRVPLTDPLPAVAGELRLYTGEPSSAPVLSSFRLTGAWLVARLGDRHLIALDLQGRRVAWVLGSNARPGYRPVSFPDAPRFGPEFAATGRVVVVQLSDGRRWFVRADTGKLIDIPGFDQPTARSWWQLPPTEVELNRLAVSDGPGLVRLLNLATGRVKWTRQELRKISLAGDPPQVRAWGEVVVVAVRRNHGVELERIDLTEGKSLWEAGPAFLDADRVNLARADADAERLYVPAADSLTAFRLRDGGSVWTVGLGPSDGGSWIVRAGRGGLVVTPETAIPREPVARVVSRLLRSFRRDPATWRLAALLARLYDAWIDRAVPVLLLDSRTGQRLAEFRVPAVGPAVTTWFDRDCAVVATGDRVVWLR